MIGGPAGGALWGAVPQPALHQNTCRYLTGQPLNSTLSLGETALPAANSTTRPKAEPQHRLSPGDLLYRASHLTMPSSNNIHSHKQILIRTTAHERMCLKPPDCAKRPPNTDLETGLVCFQKDYILLFFGDPNSASVKWSQMNDR